MPETPLLKPLSAYVGFLLASLEDARGEGRSTGAVVAHLPIAAAGQLLTARHRYDQLAEQGDVVIDVVVGMVRGRLGSSDDHFAHEAADADGWMADEYAAGVDLADALADELADELADSADLLVLPNLVEPAVAPEPVPSPLEQLEQFSVPAEIGQAAGGLKTAADLPLADFDHMSGPQLRGRLRTLDRVQLVQLLDYERAHAHRVGIVQMLENRLTKLIDAEGPTGS